MSFIATCSLIYITTGLLPLTDWEKMKIFMCYVFAQPSYELDSLQEVSWLKDDLCMTVREYTEELQKMITRLDPTRTVRDPTDSKEEKVHHYNTRSSHAIQDELYLIHITIMKP